MIYETKLSCTFQYVGGSFSAKVPRSSTEVRRVFIHDIMEVDAVGQKGQQGDQRDDEEGEEVNGGAEEIRNCTRNEMTHAHATWDECELEPCRPLSHCSVRLSEQRKTVKGR